VEASKRNLIYQLLSLRTKLNSSNFVFKGEARSCDEYVEKTIFEKHEYKDDHPYIGKFIPKDIRLTQYGFDGEGPYYVFLQVNITDPNFNPLNFNETAQESYLRLDAYYSGKFLKKSCLN
jgi:hypothetical protein